MIPAGLLDRLRLRARCYALRVRTVDELEQQRDDARGRARAAEVERDQALLRAERAEQAVERAKGELRNYGHRTSTDPYGLWHDVDNALNAERVKLNHAEGVGHQQARAQVAMRLGVPVVDAQSITAVDLLDRVGALVDVQVAHQVPREAYDPAMGGDIEPPPGRPVPCGAAVPWVNDSRCTLPAEHLGEHVEVPF